MRPAAAGPYCLLLPLPNPMPNRMIAARHAFASPGIPDADGLVVLARRSAHRRMRTWPRRPLLPGERALMWLLRLYVIAVLGIVVLQIFRLN